MKKLKKIIRKPIKHLVKRHPKFVRMKKTEVIKKIKKLPWWEEDFNKWLSL